MCVYICSYICAVHCSCVFVLYDGHQQAVCWLIYVQLEFVMGCSVAAIRIWAVMKTSAHVCDPGCRDNRVYAFYMFLNFSPAPLLWTKQPHSDLRCKWS